MAHGITGRMVFSGANGLTTRYTTTLVTTWSLSHRGRGISSRPTATFPLPTQLCPTIFQITRPTFDPSMAFWARSWAINLLFSGQPWVMKHFWEFGHVTQLGQLNWGIWFLKSGCFQAGDQAAHRPLHPSYAKHSLHRVNVILDGALILRPNFWYVAEEQPAWADQRSYSQTRHALLAYRHSYPWAAAGAAGLPLQEVQHRQTGPVPQIPHRPWCCGKPLLFRSIAKAKTCKPRHVHFPCFLPRCWPTSSLSPPHWRPCRAPTSALAVGITGRL